eukprot:913965-Amorphochlora_amoeboformis.AAC.1
MDRFLADCGFHHKQTPSEHFETFQQCFIDSRGAPDWKEGLRLYEKMGGNEKLISKFLSKTAEANPKCSAYTNGDTWGLPSPHVPMFPIKQLTDLMM